MEHPVFSPDKRFYSSPKQRQTVDTGKCTAMDQDCTDNATAFYKTKLLSPATCLTNANGSDTTGSPKSFIQQRVERLYGPGALAQGFYSPIRTRNNLSILSERSQNADSTPSPKLFKSDARPNGQNVAEKKCLYGGNEMENVNQIDEQSLPVLRHLRPEFRAQLPMLSPKRGTCKLSSEFVRMNNSHSQTTNILSSSLAVTTTSSLPPIHTADEITTTTSSSSAPNKNHVLSNDCNSLSVVNDCNATNFINGFVSEAVSSVNSMTLSENNKNGCSNSRSNGVGKIVIEPKSLPAVLAENSVKNGSENNVGKVNTMNNNNCKNSNNNCIVTNGNIEMVNDKDGTFFINIIKIERDRLLGLALATENDLETLLQVIEYYIILFINCLGAF